MIGEKQSRVFICLLKFSVRLNDFSHNTHRKVEAGLPVLAEGVGKSLRGNFPDDVILAAANLARQTRTKAGCRDGESV